MPLPRFEMNSSRIQVQNFISTDITCVTCPLLPFVFCLIISVHSFSRGWVWRLKIITCQVEHDTTCACVARVRKRHLLHRCNSTRRTCLLLPVTNFMTIFLKGLYHPTRIKHFISLWLSEIMFAFNVLWTEFTVLTGVKIHLNERLEKPLWRRLCCRSYISW